MCCQSFFNICHGLINFVTKYIKVPYIIAHHCIHIVCYDAVLTDRPWSLHHQNKKKTKHVAHRVVGRLKKASDFTSFYKHLVRPRWCASPIRHTIGLVRIGLQSNPTTELAHRYASASVWKVVQFADRFCLKFEIPQKRLQFCPVRSFCVCMCVFDRNHRTLVDNIFI